MRNEFFFQLDISDEQIALANRLVDFSIKNHPVTDIFSKDPDGKARQREYRFTGTLGEIVFADTYKLSRPTKSFGAIDGQDFGQDFVIEIHGERKTYDVKTMGRKNNQFRENYVLNLPAYQMRRPNVVTDFYFCISIHQKEEKYFASFLGFVSKAEIEAGEIGILYKAGAKRVKDDGGFFHFQRDTYEVDFRDISSPMLSNRIKTLQGFMLKKILPPFRS